VEQLNRVYSATLSDGGVVGVQHHRFVKVSLVLEGLEQRCPTEKLWTSAHAKTYERTYLSLRRKQACVLLVLGLSCASKPTLTRGQEGFGALGFSL
jgi:hypothetical protein